MLTFEDIGAELRKRLPELLLEGDRVLGGDYAGAYEMFGYAIQSLCHLLANEVPPSSDRRPTTAVLDAAIALFDEMAESSDPEVVSLLKIEVMEGLLEAPPRISSAPGCDLELALC